MSSNPLDDPTAEAGPEVHEDSDFDENLEILALEKRAFDDEEGIDEDFDYYLAIHRYSKLTVEYRRTDRKTSLTVFGGDIVL